MAIDTPAKIAIIGAGPIGLEAAIYARFLGYEVELFEQGRICENLLRAGAARLEGPFGQHCSTLVLAALSAQDPNWRPPAVDAILTSAEWAEQYLAPLAKSDLVTDSLHEGVAVTRLRRADAAETSAPSDEFDEMTSPPFLLTTRDAAGQEAFIQADAVIDCSGIAAANDPATDPAHDWLRELQIEFCPKTGAPRGMAEFLARGMVEDGSPPWRPLVTSEPDFYILGAKSYGRAAPFSFALGLAQIRDLFTLIHDRPDLNIYQRMAGGFRFA